jgi:D-amino-acid dehydrogenase
VRAEVLVIGGGLAGVTSFYELASRKIETILLEASDEVALGASFANGAMLTPSMSDPWNNPGVGRHLIASLFNPGSAILLQPAQLPDLWRWGLQFLQNATPHRHWIATKANFALAHYSLAETRRTIASLGIAMDSNRSGSLKVFETPESMAAPRALAQRLAPLGLDFHELDVAAAVALEPQLTPIAARLVGALHYPGDASGDARMFTQQLAAAARQEGGVLRCGEPVCRILQGPKGFEVETGKGLIRANKLVLAAGTATPTLARQLGIRLPIKPAKGYSLTYTLKSGVTAPRIPVVDDAMHAAVVPLGNRIRAVGTAEFAGEDRSVNGRRLDNLARLFARLYPDIASKLDRDAAEGWAGLRPMSADGRPFVGDAGRNIWINAGHGHLGWTMASGSARLLCDLMLTGGAQIDHRPYAIGRNRS